MNISLRPGSVIPSKCAEFSESVNCIACASQFVPPSVESATMQICPPCEELFNENSNDGEEKMEEEDFTNVSHITLLISIALVLFAYW